MKLNILLILISITAFNIVTFGQKAPTVRQRGKQVVEINNIMGKVPRLSCNSPATYRGRILKRNFDNDGITITGFILSDARGRKQEINFNRKQIKLLGQYSVNIVSTLLTTGKRVRVSTYECSGGSGTFRYANRIQAL